MKMLESRHSHIKQRVITLSGVRALGTIIAHEHAEYLKKSKQVSISFSAYCDDDSSYESEDISLFSSDSPINQKKVHSIEITLHLFESDSYVKIQITHGDGIHQNSLTIRGSDSNWVNGITKRLEDTIAAFQPQSTWLDDYKYAIDLLFALSFGAIFVHLVWLFPTDPPISTPWWARILRELFQNYPLMFPIFRYVLGIPVGIFPAELLRQKLLELWPSIELQIGPEHTLIEKKRREWLTGAVVLGVLPIILTFIYDLIKAWAIR
jgi:hypothetical protein